MYICPALYLKCLLPLSEDLTVVTSEDEVQVYQYGKLFQVFEMIPTAVTVLDKDTFAVAGVGSSGFGVYIYERGDNGVFSSTVQILNDSQYFGSALAGIKVKCGLLLAVADYRAMTDTVEVYLYDFSDLNPTPTDPVGTVVVAEGVAEAGVLMESTSRTSGHSLPEGFSYLLVGYVGGAKVYKVSCDEKSRAIKVSDPDEKKVTVPCGNTAPAAIAWMGENFVVGSPGDVGVDAKISVYLRDPNKPGWIAPQKTLSLPEVCNIDKIISTSKNALTVSGENCGDQTRKVYEYKNSGGWVKREILNEGENFGPGCLNIVGKSTLMIGDSEFGDSGRLYMLPGEEVIDGMNMFGKFCSGYVPAPSGKSTKPLPKPTNQIKLNKNVEKATTPKTTTKVLPLKKEKDETKKSGGGSRKNLR